MIAPRGSAVPAIILRLSRDEHRALLSALPCAMRCQLEAQLARPLSDDWSEIGCHRRTLCRLFWRLWRAEDETEAEVSLLRRAGVLLMVAAARVTQDRWAFRALAAKIRRALARWEGDDDALCGWG